MSEIRWTLIKWLISMYKESSGKNRLLKIFCNWFILTTKWNPKDIVHRIHFFLRSAGIKADRALYKCWIRTCLDAFLPPNNLQRYVDTADPADSRGSRCNTGLIKHMEEEKRLTAKQAASDRVTTRGWTHVLGRRLWQSTVISCPATFSISCPAL